MGKQKEIVNKLLDALNEIENDKMEITNLVVTYELKDVYGFSTTKIFHMGEVKRSIELLKKTVDVVEKDVE